MSGINFVIGLTDVEDYDGFVYGDTGGVTENTTRVNYNIRKAPVDIEKASISWTLDTTLDITKNIIKVWEHIIRRPHLNMINMAISENIFAADYKHYDFSVSFLNLIPLLSDYKILMTLDDYNHMREHNDFGDMVVELFSLHTESGLITEETLSYAYYNDTTEFLKPHKYPFVVPIFNFDFKIQPRPINNANRTHSYRFLQWANKNKDVLAEKGYTLDIPYCNVGVLRIGKLIGDPMEEYEKLQKYSRVCRTSMVLVEE
jgi:hypothetical protein